MHGAKPFVPIATGTTKNGEIYRTLCYPQLMQSYLLLSELLFSLIAYLSNGYLSYLCFIKI